MSEEQVIGTDLYRRCCEKWQPRDVLSLAMWSETPWMVDVYEGSFGTWQYRGNDMVEYCLDKFGPQAFLTRESGKWRCSGATVSGWTVYGFANEDMMNRFLEAFPNPVGGES